MLGTALGLASPLILLPDANLQKSPHFGTRSQESDSPCGELRAGSGDQFSRWRRRSYFLDVWFCVRSQTREADDHQMLNLKRGT